MCDRTGSHGSLIPKRAPGQSDPVDHYGVNVYGSYWSADPDNLICFLTLL